ncbi:MAG TPA: ABC transporter ATP-binding protein [Thermoplasmata archaeon]|nr:ABC transporter ATP-binding protein [Thermoplasmata archaeon]
MDELLRIEDLSVHYKTLRGEVRAIDGVSLTLPEGETVGVVGETGCGKSTLGKAILGVLPYGTRVTGHVWFRGKDLPSLAEEDFRLVRGKDLALIFQDPMTRLNPLMTIDAHFVETIRAHEDVREDEARERAVSALTSMGIPESRIHNFPHEFSGGMRQRIMIALALVLRPSLLIADEPTTSLDVIVEAGILEILEDLKRAYRMSLLLITHNLGIVAEVCDRVAVLYAGRLVEIGAVRDIFARPIHPYTRGLLRSVIHLETKELFSIDGSPPDLYEPPSGCRFHPRCPFAKDVCRDVDPPLVEFRTGQRAACHFGGEFL